MTLKTISILLCASIFVNCAAGKEKLDSERLPPDQGNHGIEYGPKRIARQYSQYYGSYGNQNDYGSQGTYQDVNGYNPVGQESYGGHGQQNKNSGFISGQIRPGQTVSIGSGHGRTNVVAINSAGDTDYYVGYTDGGVNTNTGYDQGYPPKKGHSGIIVNKKPGGQEDVLLWSANGNKQNSIAVDSNGGAHLYSGNDYENPYQPYNQQNHKPIIQQGTGKPAGRNAYQSSSIYSQQDQIYLNSQRYY